MELARDWRTGPQEELYEPPFQADSPPMARPLGPLRCALGRAFDVSGSVVLLLVAAPLVLLGTAIVLTNGGRPIFFGHVRVGKGGRLFRCWKLRTMHRDAEARLHADPDLYRRYVENGYKLSDAEDPRLLPGGRWLRRRYIDELPQLWNVLRGDMSLVGWRPVVPGQMDLFGAHAASLLLRRPGLFGEWTSRGRRRPPYPDRVTVEVELVHDPTVWRTARILARSVGAVLAGSGDEG